MKLSLAFKILRDAGPSWAAQRVRLAWEERSGRLRRAAPVQRWEAFDTALGHVPHKLFSRSAHFEGHFEEADSIVAGRFGFFSGTDFNLGSPPDWRMNPFTNQRAESDAHWSDIPWDVAGDIKCVWELSRFAWVFPLVRAYAATGDERYAQIFWQMFEDWCANNPPNAGIQWKCGQETTLRMIHALIGAEVFGNAGRAGRKMPAIAAFARAHAQRISVHVDYALSQRNNHAVSEAVGLFTAGSLFPDLEDAGRWQEQGRKLLESLAREQIYDDGSYLQHSFNYQRFSLAMLLWAIQVDDLTGKLLSVELRSRTLKCAEMLASVTDPATGGVPNTGGNDGAHLFPLSACPYGDFRPVVQWAFGKLAGRRVYPPGPWDETARWFGCELPPTPSPVERRSAPRGGHHLLQGADSWALLRCAQYQDRPFHADQLHLDLFHRGNAFLLDPGTYAYNPQPNDDWDNPLSSTAVHNTVTVDDRDPMLRAGRFLWLDWAQGRVLHQEPGAITAEHEGYKPVRHRRSVAVTGDAWEIVDELAGPGAHACELHWLCAAGEWTFAEGELTIQTAGSRMSVVVDAPGASFRIVRAGKVVAGDGDHPADQFRGWFSPTYRVKVPAISLVARNQGLLPLKFTTRIRLDSK